MSFPGAKAFVPAPRIMMQRTLSLAESSVNTSPSRFHIGLVRALSFSGRLRTTVTMSPPSRTRTVSSMSRLAVEVIHQAHAGHGHIGDEKEHCHEDGDEIDIHARHFPHRGL